jgi:HD domain
MKRKAPLNPHLTSVDPGSVQPSQVSAAPIPQARSANGHRGSSESPTAPKPTLDPSRTPETSDLFGAALPQLEVDPLAAAPSTALCFVNRHRFTDEVHGAVHANDLERDAIDSPEFQRLFRILQLGLVDLLYPAANHTRGAHSIGTLYCAQLLLSALRENHERLINDTPPSEMPKPGTPSVYLAPRITRAEEVLIRLGALLHDISHGPYSHDIERKTHYLYPYSDSITHESGPRVRVSSFYGPSERVNESETDSFRI